MLLFSFKHLDLSNDKFSLAKCKSGYVDKLLGRMKNLCAMRVEEFRTNKSPSIRAHSITWSETSEPNGFTSLNQQLRDEQAFQFEITKSAHGRVHGFLLDSTFYVVWIDPDHALYS